MSQNWGFLPQEVFYRTTVNGKYPRNVVFSVPNGDWRQELAKAQAPHMSFELRAKGSKWVNIPLAVTGAVQYPLEIWGADPSHRNNMPKVFIRQENCNFHPGWNEWSFVGIYQKVVGRKTPSSFMAQFLRRSSSFVMVEPQSNIQRIFTAQEAMARIGFGIVHPDRKEIEKTLLETKYMLGYDYIDPYSNLPRGATSKAFKKIQDEWDFFDHNTQEAQDFQARHFVNINGNTYVQSLDFGLDGDVHVPETKAITPR